MKKEKIQAVLLAAGRVICTLLVLLGAARLSDSGRMSAGIMERVVAGYIESALASLVITEGGAAVLELLPEEE